MIVDLWRAIHRAFIDLWEFIAYPARERVARRPSPIMDPWAAETRWRERLTARPCGYCRVEMTPGADRCATCGAPARPGWLP